MSLTPDGSFPSSSFSVPDPATAAMSAIESAKSSATSMVAKVIKDANLTSKLEAATQKVAEVAPAQTILDNAPTPELGFVPALLASPILAQSVISKKFAPDASIPAPELPLLPSSGICPITLPSIPLPNIGSLLPFPSFGIGDLDPASDLSLLEEVMNEATAAFDALIGVLSEIDGIITSALTQFETLAASLGSLIPTQADVLAFVNNLLPDTGSGDTFADIQSAISGILPDGLDVSEFVNAVKSKISEITGGVGSGTGDLGTAISEVASSAFGHLESGTQFIIEGANGIYSFTMEQAEALYSGLESACLAVTGCLGIDGVSDIVDSALTNATGDVSGMISQIQGQLGDRLSGISVPV